MDQHVNDLAMMCFSVSQQKGLKACLFGNYQQMMYVFAKFSLNGRNSNTIEGQFIEESKKIFRKHIIAAGGLVPAQVATWDGKTLKFKKRPNKIVHEGEVWPNYGPKRKVLVKLYDGWFQAGDTLVEDFDESSPEKMAEFKKMLETNYDGVEVLIMDLISPDPKMGSHAFDIRSMRCPDGSI